MINFPRDRIGTASHDSFDEYFIGDIEEEEDVSGDSGSGEGCGLSRGAGKAVEEPAVFDAVGFVEAVFDLGYNIISFGRWRLLSE